MERSKLHFMLLPIIITAIALFTAIVAVIAAKEVILDDKKKGWRKLNVRGYVVILCAICMSILPLVQYYIQNQQDTKKENDRKAETEKHDADLRKEYEAHVLMMKKEFTTSARQQQSGYQASVAEQRSEYAASVRHIRRDFGDSNNRTLIVIGQTLAKYKLQLDTAEKLIRDSAKIVLPDQPALHVTTTPDGLGIQFLKFEVNENHYHITFMSEGGGSCCYDLKMSAVVLDSALQRPAYKGPIRMALTPNDNLAKDGWQSWTFTINNSHPYDWLYIWVRGTYLDLNGNHTYHIDKVYYNRKGPNTFGSIGVDMSNEVKLLVHRFEKD
jgi:hypothetical protein